MEQELTTNNVLLPIAATPEEMRRNTVAFPRLNTLRREDAVAQMVAVVRAACLYRNTRMEATDIAFTAAALVDELLTDTRYGLPFISFGEIRRAVRHACLYTDMYGVSVTTLYRAIVDYAKGEGTQANKAITAPARKTAAQIAATAAAGAFVKSHKITTK